MKITSKQWDDAISNAMDFAFMKVVLPIFLMIFWTGVGFGIGCVTYFMWLGFITWNAVHHVF